METYHGHVRTPADAIVLFEACRIGLLPRVQRRLSEKERQSIKSGSVFVWDEREAGMRRWTDGKSWSASRVSGSFLTYREMEGKRGGNNVAQPASRAGKTTPESNRGSDEDQGDGTEEGPDGYRYKPDGLMKQSFSITTSTGQHLHLISYYARSHPTAPGLNQPSTDPALRHIRPQKGLYPESSVNDQQNLPVVTRGPMGGAAFSVPPQLGSYGRTAATHPHSYSPSPYGWPAPPMTGPQHVPVISYVPNYLPPLAPGANGHGQYPYNQHPHPQNPQNAYPSQYDNRVVVHPADAHPAHHMHSGALHNNHNNMHNVPLYATGPPQGHMPPPTTMFGPAGGVHQAGAQIDPRLTASPATPRYDNMPNNLQPNQTKSPPAPDNHSPPHTTAPPNGNNPEPPSTSANSVPSINALMNSTPPVTSTGDNKPTTAYQQNGPQSTNGQANGSTAEGPKDIPSDKIGFGEDMRALRQLDSVFTA